MTLAQRICEHCTPHPADEQDGFGSLLGTVYPLRDLLSRWFGQTVEFADGVSVMVPRSLEWKTSDLSDGGVQFAFSDPAPVIVAQHSVLRVSSDLTGLVLHIDARALEIEARLRRFPDFTLTVPLGGPDAG